MGFRPPCTYCTSPPPPPPRPHLHDELFLALGPCKACSLPQRPGHRRTLLPHEPERPSAPDLSFCKRRPQPRELGNLLSCTLHVSNAANRLLIFWIFCFACWETLYEGQNINRPNPASSEMELSSQMQGSPFFEEGAMAL